MDLMLEIVLGFYCKATFHERRLKELVLQEYIMVRIPAVSLDFNLMSLFDRLSMFILFYSFYFTFINGMFYSISLCFPFRCLV